MIIILRLQGYTIRHQRWKLEFHFILSPATHCLRPSPALYGRIVACKVSRAKRKHTHTQKTGNEWCSECALTVIWHCRMARTNQKQKFNERKAKLPKLILNFSVSFSSLFSAQTTRIEFDGRNTKQNRTSCNRFYCHFINLRNAVCIAIIIIVFNLFCVVPCRETDKRPVH